jgi:hypothetical protein
MSLREELASIDAEIKVLEQRQRQIYRDSLQAPADQKVCSDSLAKMCAEDWERFGYPVTVSGINFEPGTVYKPERFLGPDSAGAWVAIRPCSDNKTYLGVLLGDIALGIGASYHKESGVLSVMFSHHNPAIWVPDLKKIVFGAESWWGALEKPEDLRQITEADIQSVWYVQALKALEAKR